MIGTVVTRGYSNGTLTGSIGLVVVRGYVAEPAGERETLSVQAVDEDGAQISWTALVSGGHQVVMSNDSALLIKNGATGFNLTVQATVLVDGDLEVSDRVIAIASNEDYVIRLKDIGIYLQAAGTVYLDYSDTTNGEVAVLR